MSHCAYALFAQAKAHPTIQMLWKRSPFQRPFNKWLIAYFLAVSSLADPLPQLTTMLKWLWRGWVSGVINDKANEDLRDARNRDNSQKAQPFLPPRHLRNPGIGHTRNVIESFMWLRVVRIGSPLGCKRRAVLPTTLPCATPRGRNEMKSMIIVNHWGCFTHWRSSLFLFIFEVIRHVHLWNSLRAATLVEQYGREEVRVITDASAPRRSCGGDILADLFKSGCRTCYAIIL